MSYIPPHKRHSKDPLKPTPFPDSLVTKFNKNLDLKKTSAKENAIVFSGDFISKWFLIGSNGIEDEVPPSLKLVPMSTDPAERKDGIIPLVLMTNDKDCVVEVKTKESEEEERIRWMLVVEKIEEDLVFAYEKAKKGMEDRQLLDNSELSLVARFGKMIFYGREAGPMAEYSQENTKRIFSTDVPAYFIQNIKTKAIPNHEFSIEMEKEIYIVKVSHYSRPDATISCKCIAKEDGRLSMYKAERNPVRHLVVDVSCIDKNLDMRFMLRSKKETMDLTEEEISNIKEVLDLATVDPDAKGGVRWPPGKTSSRDGFRLFEVCHERATTYKNRTLKLRVKETDRFNQRYGTREINGGVTLILEVVNNKLQGGDIEKGYVMEMLRDALETIWDFLL